MRATVEPFSAFSVPRVSQLTQRSNQFNLRTIRYSEEDIKNVIASDQHMSMQISLEDKYGEYGIIGLVIGEKKEDVLFIDTWIMSCRVLKRGVEKMVLNQLVELAKQHNCISIVGEYIPTAKNKLVETHYVDLGFEPLSENQYSLNMNTFSAFPTKIELK